jgi:SPP1 gp7 family putative phage head morphogenesis protein
MRLVALTDDMTATTAREITRLYRHPDVVEYFKGFAQDISPASQARILTNQLQARFEQLFASAAKPTAESMADEANKASETDTTRSLRDLSLEFTLKPGIVAGSQMEEFLKATIANNVNLIKSIPSEYFMKVQGAVLRSIADGKGLEDLTPFFAEQKGVEERRAKNIALDQTHKAYNGLNKSRMQSVGVQQFEWVHSGGGLHPRELHLYELNGKIFSFNKLPIIEEGTGERGIPGQAINCRCTMVPIVKLTDDKGANNG